MEKLPITEWVQWNIEHVKTKQYNGAGYMIEILESILPRIEELEKQSKNKPYTVAMSPLFVQTISKLFKFCVENGRHEFFVREILMTRGEYTNLSKLQRFGLLYRVKDYETGKKIKGGLYGMNIERVRDFLDDKYSVAKEYSVDGDSTILSEERITISQIPKKGWETEYGKHRETLIPSFIKLNSLHTNSL